MKYFDSETLNKCIDEVKHDVLFEFGYIISQFCKLELFVYRRWFTILNKTSLCVHFHKKIFFRLFCVPLH